MDQSKLADFLDAKRDKDQFVFWKLYDFNYIPVELISRIYEEFIPERKDIAYTPTHLVNFMVDECMPVSSPKTNFKVIDVSCGSGIFLVAAFKRIVQWWQKEQYEKYPEVKPPTLAKLKSILANSIHGVDIERESVSLAKFSLTLALLDMLDPTRMWEELTKEKLINLSNNIIKQDFFDFKAVKEFDLVVGNPPFNLPVRPENEKEYWESLIKKAKPDFGIPQKSIPLLFLQQAMMLLKKGGLLSLVMPSGALLYNDTLEYRKNFLSKYNVPQIFDFSSLNAILFAPRNVAVSVIFVQNNTPDDKDILHVVIKRTTTTKERLYFEIDKYDLHYVPKELAKTEQIIWKTNSLGGGHLYYLRKRVQGLRTLEKYLKEKRKHGWVYGTGYFVGEPTRALNSNVSKRKPAKHLENQRLIPTDKFNNDVINESDIIIEKETSFEGRREKKGLIFKAPHILIKTNIELPVLLYDKDLIFRRDITGIYAPEKKDLAEVENNIKRYRLLYQGLLMLASGRIGIGRATSVRSKDVLMLPYPENKDDLELSKAEQIVIDDLLKYGLSQGENSKVNTTTATLKTLTVFAKVFCDSLNSIYDNDNKRFYALDYVESQSYICYPFAYGNPEKPKKISKEEKAKIETGDLTSLLDNRQGLNVLYKRIIKLYPNKDMVYLIKPKILRYWLKSMALRDASETFTDLVSSGY